MDQFLSVQAFIHIVETGSFVKTSVLMDMHPNAVTKLIQALESHLRVKLLNRTTRRVTPTNDGSAYYERMRHIMQQWQEAETDLSVSHGNLKGKLRIDMGSTMASLLVIPALPAFHAKYPDMQLDIGVGDSTIDLASNSVDCVIRGGKLEDSSLVARRLGSLPFVTCATPEYLAAHPEIKHPSDLEVGHKLIRYFFAKSGRQSPIEFKKGNEKIVVEGSYFVAVNDANAHLAAGLAGLGVIQTLTFMAQPHIEEGRLVPILEDWSNDPNTISIVYIPNRHLSTKTRTFVEWIVEYFRSHPHTTA